MINKKFLSLILGVMVTSSAFGQKMPNSSNAPTEKLRMEWMQDPNPNIPAYVTDQDIENLTYSSFNKIIGYLRSPKMISAYNECKKNEEKFISERIALLRKNASSALIQSERDALNKQADANEKVKRDIAPATCIFRTIRRVTITMNLANLGSPDRSGNYEPIDEQYNVTQLFRVARALENNQLTEKFHGAMAAEISIPYDQWFRNYVIAVAKENADVFMAASKGSERNAFSDQGIAVMTARKEKVYEKRISATISYILSGDIKP